MLASEIMQMFIIIYYVILYMSQVISFEDIQFLIRIIGYLVLYRKNTCIFKK